MRRRPFLRTSGGLGTVLLTGTGAARAAAGGRSRARQDQPGFTLEHDDRVPKFVYPLDPRVLRPLTVVNGDTAATYESAFEVTGEGGFHVTDAGILPFPQPNRLYLGPGESQDVFQPLEMLDFDRERWVDGETYSYAYEIAVMPAGGPDAAKSVELPFRVHVLNDGLPGRADQRDRRRPGHRPGDR